MGEAEGFFAESLGKFLLFFNRLLVKDSAQLIQRVRCIAVQGRDVLRRILANVDCSRCNGRSCRAVRIALGRHGKVGGEAYGVIDLVLLLSAHLVIVAVVVMRRYVVVIRVLLYLIHEKLYKKSFLLFQI